MRFYLDLPLVVGYIFLATSACLGVLQVAAARGGYRGLSLFATSRKTGVRIGAGLTVGSVIAYVLFAPEILTPGPAGTEVAAMFAVCAVAALVLTLAGADLKLRRAEIRPKGEGERLQVSSIPATLYRSSTTHPSALALDMSSMNKVPVVVLIPDPAGFITTPGNIVGELCSVGLAVLVVETRQLAQRNEPLRQRMLSEYVATAISAIRTQPGIDEKCAGLLAVGWAADLILSTEANNIRINATMVVSPVACAPLKPGMTAPGLGWLQELSYSKVWRWRRRGPTLIYEAQEMALKHNLEPGRLSESKVGNGHLILTTRNSDPIEPLPVKSQRYFALLDDRAVRQLAVQWFREVLVSNS